MTFSDDIMYRRTITTTQFTQKIKVLNNPFLPYYVHNIHLPNTTIYIFLTLQSYAKQYTNNVNTVGTLNNEKEIYVIYSTCLGVVMSQIKSM